MAMAKRARSEEPPESLVQPVLTRPRLGDIEAVDELTRILSWNVENPTPFLQLPDSKARSAANATPTFIPGSHPPLLRNMIRRHEYPHFVCLQEVRARHSDKEWISALRLAANFGSHGGPTNLHPSASDPDVTADPPPEPKYTMYHSLNRATRGQRHFGVVTFVRDPGVIAAAREVDWDAEGRVLILEMRAGWALLNVYALNGSEFMWRDPLRQAAPKTRNERKREFNTLLMQECMALQSRGLRVVLIGDFNISLAKMDCRPRLRTEFPHGLARREFKEQFIPTAQVVDVFREVHPDLKSYSWFARGKPQGADCARVDYALVQKCLRGNAVDVVYFEDPQERAHSDHAPLVLTMKDMSGLMNSSEIMSDAHTAVQSYTSKSALMRENGSSLTQPQHHSRQKWMRRRSNTGRLSDMHILACDDAELYHCEKRPRPRVNTIRSRTRRDINSGANGHFRHIRGTRS